MIQVERLSKTFIVHRQKLRAVDNVSFSIDPGQTFGLVGESGCGKSTLGRTLLMLYEPTDGSIFFHGENITHAANGKMKWIRRRMQMIFQDPFASLNPRMTVGDIISEPLDVHEIGTFQEKKSHVLKLLDLVNLPQNSISRFPHEFSGGQRQRIGIARALALQPEFIVCDEPVSALDVSIQAQIANLLLTLQKEFHLTYLFIAHDLAMIKVLASLIAIMYLGSFVEMGPVDQIYSNPLHPYTQILLASVPHHDPMKERNRKKILLSGEPPSPFHPPKGCNFCHRCPKAMPICFEKKPILKEINPGHSVACHFS